MPRAITILLGLAAPPLVAQDQGRQAPVPPSAGADSAFREWLDGGQALGTWGGVRADLADRGISFGGSFVADWSDVWGGGIRQRDTFRSLLDVNLEFDLETLVGLPRTVVFLDAYRIFGRDGSADTGDLQAYSNIDGTTDGILAEAWLESRLWQDRLRLKIGKVDANTEFAFLEEGRPFLNSSAGFTPTILDIPTYPDPAMSINAFVYPSFGGYLGLGFYDGSLADGVRTGRRGPSTFFSDDRSDESFLIGETGWTWDTDAGPARIAGGAWHHTATRTRFDGGIEDGTSGLFALYEQRLWSEDPEADDDQGIALMLSGGLADEDVADIPLHGLVGLTWTGALPGRDADVTGIMVSHADLSDRPGAGFPGNETLYELFHEFRITPFLAVKPTVQWMDEPSGDPTIGPTWIGTLRFEIAF